MIRLAALMAIALAVIYVGFWLTDKVLERQRKRRGESWRKIARAEKAKKENGLLRPVVLDEFAGPLAGTCGQVEPGTWQCNCVDPEAGCLVLKELKSPNEEDDTLPMTNRRAAIRAQKARKSDGN